MSLFIRKDRPAAASGTTINGFRIILRPPQESDWPAWAKVRAQNRGALKPYEPAWAKVRAQNRGALKPYEPAWPEDCLTRNFYMRRLRKQIRDRQEDRGYPFLIFDKQGKTLIGTVNINNVCRGAAQYATLGYWLDRAYQRQGYMSEALRLVISYGFENLRLHRFQAASLPHNERSIGLLTKLGFEKEGFAAKYVQINGIWEDHVLFGLPVEHWRESALKQDYRCPAKAGENQR